MDQKGSDVYQKVISVVITAYNRTEFLPLAIGSVLKQVNTECEIEIIVVSNVDFGIDNLPSGCVFKKIIMEGTIGEFLSIGIESSSGDIIAFLDDDDVWMANRIMRLQSVFFNSNIVFYHNMYSYVDSQGNPLKYSRKVEKNNSEVFKSQFVFNSASRHKQLSEAIERKADFNLSCIAVRKSLALEYVGALKMITSAPDGFFFWTAIISRGELFIDHLKLTQYRVHEFNISGARSYKDKARELQREIKTFEILISLVNSTSMEEIASSVIKKWLKLYDEEYKLMALVFDDRPRTFIAITIFSLIKTGLRARNTLKYRALGFGILGIIDSSLARIVYERIG